MELLKTKRILKDIVRTLISENDLLKALSVEAVNTANYVINRYLIRLILKKTPYELFKDKKPNVSY